MDVEMAESKQMESGASESGFITRQILEKAIKHVVSDSQLVENLKPVINALLKRNTELEPLRHPRNQNKRPKVDDKSKKKQTQSNIHKISAADDQTVQEFEEVRKLQFQL